MYVCFLFWYVLLVQEKHATMEGVVKQGGTPISGAQVILQLEQCDCASCANSDSCQCCPGLTLTLTDGMGHYTISVPAGTYSLRVKIAERQPYRLSNLGLNAGEVVYRNFDL
ncbi:carboxypeptidase-like regulatory domain-containing protein [bacterium]|nr:carboxypeptidase-like regulatory domain-containing protein [bacterium]